MAKAKTTAPAKPEAKAAETPAAKQPDAPATSAGSGEQSQPAAPNEAPAAEPAKKTAPKEKAATPNEDIKILFIKSRAKSFRRCGFRFNQEGYGIALDALTDEQIDILENDPNLVVTRGTATDNAE